MYEYCSKVTAVATAVRTTSSIRVWLRTYSTGTYVRTVLVQIQYVVQYSYVRVLPTRVLRTRVLCTEYSTRTVDNKYLTCIYRY